MGKQRFHYIITGYQWAPESYRVRKQLPGRPPKDVPLTPEERHEVGMLYMTRGFEVAVGYVKHTERAGERQLKRIITYGFHAKEAPYKFVYCPQLTCHADAPLSERLRIFKTVRGILKEAGGRVTLSTQTELDGAYRPTDVRENTVTVDFARPCVIPRGQMLIQDGPGRSYRAKARPSKGVTPHKRRDLSPSR